MATLHAFLVATVHACSTIILHANATAVRHTCSLAIAHACFTAIVRACSMATAHVCCMRILHACAVACLHDTKWHYTTLKIRKSIKTMTICYEINLIYKQTRTELYSRGSRQSAYPPDFSLRRRKTCRVLAIHGCRFLSRWPQPIFSWLWQYAGLNGLLLGARWSIVSDSVLSAITPADCEKWMMNIKAKIVLWC